MTWADLAALADRELTLARDGRWEESRAIADRRDVLAPAVAAPTAADRPALELLVALQEQIVVECTLARDATARERAALTRGRSAVRAYRTATGRPASRVDGAG